MGRYSILGTRPRQVVRWSIGDDDRDPYDLVADLTEGARQATVDGLPPFTGGAVGMFGYDLVRTVETSLGAPTNPDPVGLPDLAMMLTDTLVVFDHLDRRTTILANVDTQTGDLDGAYEDAAAEIRRVREILAAPSPLPPRRRAPPSRSPGRATTPARSSSSRRAPSWSTSSPAMPSRWCRANAGRPSCPSSRSPSTRAAGRQPKPVHVLPRLR